MNEMSEKLNAEMATFRDEMMNAMAQLAMTVTPEEKDENTQKLEAAVGSLNEKMDSQAAEVGGLKDELLEAMAQIGMAVSSAPDTKSDFMALKQEFFKSKDDAEALEKEYSLQFERAIDSMNLRMQNEIEKLRNDLLGAISDVGAKSAETSAEKTERTEALSGQYSEKILSAVDQLNANLDSQVNAMKDELIEAISQVGMSVFNVSDLAEDIASVRDEIAKSNEAAAVSESGNKERFDEFADDLNARIDTQMNDLKDDVLNAISGMEAAVADGESFGASEDGEIDYDVLADKIAEKVPAIDYEALAERMKELLPEERAGVRKNGESDEEPFEIDYDLLAEKIAIIIPEVDYEELADRIANLIPQADENLIADKVASVIPQTDENEIADKVADAIPLVDYDLIAAKVAEKIADDNIQVEKKEDRDYESIAERLAAKMSASAFVSDNSGIAGVRDNNEEMFEIDYDFLAEKVAEKTATDYDLLAEKLAEKMPAFDSDEIAEKVAEASKFTGESVAVDYDELADRVANRIAEERPAESEVDYDVLAEKVAGKVATVDYDELADRVVSRVADENRAADNAVDYDLLAEKVAGKVATVDYDELADRVVSRVADGNKAADNAVDYDLLAGKLAEKVPAVNYDELASRLKTMSAFSSNPVDYDRIADKVVYRVAESGRMQGSEVDYNYLAEKLAEKVPSINYDELASRLKSMSVFSSNPVDYDRIADKVVYRVTESGKTQNNSIDYNYLADRIADKVPSINYDELASRLKSMSVFSSAPVDYDRIADRVVYRVTESGKTQNNSIDYNYLAERIADKVPSINYDELASRLKSMTVFSSAPVDYDRIADRVVYRVTESGKTQSGVDYDLLAEAVARKVPAVDYDRISERMKAAVVLQSSHAVNLDYDLLAERVSQLLANEFDVTVDESGISKIAHTVSDEINYNKVAQLVVECLKREDLFANPAPVQEREVKAEKEVKAEDEAAIAAAPQQPLPPYSYAPQPAYNYMPQPAPQPAYNYTQPAYNYAAQQPQPAPQQPQPAPKFPFGNVKKNKTTVMKQVAPSAKPAPISDEEAEEETTRYKRSFIARIIQSDEETKSYYSKLKNAILQYTRTNSQVNWSNDRFSFKGETIAKIGVNGKTLCMYIALDPEEFSTSVYHQKYEGDKKMYEKTPMMVKIKSEVGLKRALRLIPLLMEKLGAVEGDKKSVDYVQMYPFKTDEELIEEGLIKLTTVAKTGFSF